jgi:hypothetical protein
MITTSEIQVGAPVAGATKAHYSPPEYTMEYPGYSRLWSYTILISVPSSSPDTLSYPAGADMYRRVADELVPWC